MNNLTIRGKNHEQVDDSDELPLPGDGDKLENTCLCGISLVGLVLSYGRGNGVVIPTGAVSESYSRVCA